MATAKKDRLSEKASEVYRILRKTYPDAHCELTFSSPLQLLVATILSAQCTDVRVNIVTKALFRRCQSIQDYAAIPIDELEAIIQSTGFFRNKAKNIKGMAQSVLDNFSGEVPQTIEELVSLPGVGRKTANVVLGNAFSKPGLPVDTHVSRLANRIGFTTSTDPVKIEHELCNLVAQEDWCMLSHLLIFHGRRICNARKPTCRECPIADQCDYLKKRGKDGK